MNVLDLKTAVILVDHGSRRDESNAMLREVVEAYRQRAGTTIVEPAHMELAEPSIATAFGRCVERGAARVVVVPYFLAPGKHWNEDIPRLAAAAASPHAGVEYVVAPPLGLHPLMLDVIDARISEALGASMATGDCGEFADRGLVNSGAILADNERGRTLRCAPTCARDALFDAASTPFGQEVPMIRHFAFGASLLAALATSAAALGQPVVPGTGVKLTMVGDDFESPDWQYVPNGAKASYEQDENQRPPGGKSNNGRWYESAMRGQPDIVRRIATPPGGLPDSTGSLYLATKFSGVPGQLSGKQMQDDLLMGIQTRLGKAIPVTWSPSVVVRVYLPEFKRWENRSGSSFGIRCDVRGRTPAGQVEPYWPGMFILFRSETSEKYDHDFAQISVRARSNGQDVAGPVIEQSGWWTFGLSFTADGQVHQYASAGTGDLTEEDRLFSSTPYGNRAQFVDAFFVNVANLDNGRTWSTPWVIDDPAVYVVPPQGQSLAALTGRGGGEQGGAQTAVNRVFNSLR